MEIQQIGGTDYVEIMWGECFRLDGTIWMKLKSENQAVNLKDGTLGSFGDVRVQRVRAKIIVEE